MFPLFLLYVVVEFAALIAVGSAIGVLWTVVLLLAGSAVGLALVRSQGRKVMEGLRSASRGERSPGGAVADGMLFALGAVLMFVPGLVTSVVGILLLIPPTRWALRPVALRAAARWMPGVATATSRMRPTVIEGDIVEGGVAEGSVVAGEVLEGDVVEADRGEIRGPAR